MIGRKKTTKILYVCVCVCVYVLTNTYERIVD